MLLIRIALVLAFISTALAARAETVTLDALGLRVEAVQDGFSRVVAVHELGPAWQADLVAGDLLRNDVRGLIKDDARAANMVANNVVREMIVFLLDTPNPPNPLTADFSQVRLTIAAFEGGAWLDDGVRMSERTPSDEEKTELVARSTEFVDGKLAQIQSMPCSSDNKLTRADHDQAKIWANEADGYARAAGIEPLPGQSIIAAMSRRDIECRRKALLAASQERLRAFEARVGQPAPDMIEMAEFGVRLLPTELVKTNGRTTAVLQIHSVEEAGPFWQALHIRPGDLILGNAYQLERQIERDRRRWSSLQAGEPRFLNLQIYTLDEPLPPGDAPSRRIEVFPYDATGVWYGDRLAAQERARLSAGIEELSTFHDTLEAHLETLRSLGCRPSYALRNEMTRELDRLYILAGRYPRGASYAGDLNRTSRVACENEELGPVSDADMTRLAMMRGAVSHDCNDAEALTGDLEEIKDGVTRVNFALVAEFSIRELFEQTSAENRKCVVEKLLDQLTSP